ncbi:O-methyltransferase [Schlesneria paludicola]|uniref:O-methyltransferase n=1 Tax=Schlesneria paludicola TaxID=360056 RepID=UPI00029A25D9|nr:O-methyltransferase [Schlesneria paludicola]
MPKLELSRTERHLVDSILEMQVGRPNFFAWGYLVCGGVLAVFAGLNDNTAMAFTAFGLVCGFRIWEERSNSKYAPHWLSLIQKYESMREDLSRGGSSPDTWDAVDRYFNGQLIPSDGVLESALIESAAAGLPSQQVAPNQGKLLMLLAKISHARKILEIGTLGGYSTIWLARGMAEGGTVISLEADPKHAEVARGNVSRAGLAEVVDIRVGDALEALPKLAEENCGPFDLVFIDADKKSNSNYFAWAIKLCKPGSVIVVDNVVRDGTVIDRQSSDPSVQGVRRFTELFAAESRVSGTVIQTVGSKGYDGFAIALMLDK